MVLEYSAVFSQALYLDPFDALLPAIEGVLYAAPFPLGDPVHPAESDGALVVGPVTLRRYDANLIGLEEHGSVDSGEGLVEGVDACVLHKHAVETPTAAAKNIDVAYAVPLEVCLEVKGRLLPPPCFKLFLTIGLHPIGVIIQHGWHLYLVLLILGGRELVRKVSLVELLQPKDHGKVGQGGCEVVQGVDELHALGFHGHDLLAVLN